MLQVSEPNPCATGGDVSRTFVLRTPCRRYGGVVDFRVYQPTSVMSCFVGLIGGVFSWGFRQPKSHRPGHRISPTAVSRTGMNSCGGRKPVDLTRPTSTSEPHETGRIALITRRSQVQILPPPPRSRRSGPVQRTGRSCWLTATTSVSPRRVDRQSRRT